MVSGQPLVVPDRAPATADQREGALDTLPAVQQLRTVGTRSARQTQPGRCPVHKSAGVAAIGPCQLDGGKDCMEQPHQCVADGGCCTPAAVNSTASSRPVVSQPKLPLLACRGPRGSRRPASPRPACCAVGAVPNVPGRCQILSLATAGVWAGSATNDPVSDPGGHSIVDFAEKLGILGDPRPPCYLVRVSVYDLVDVVRRRTATTVTCGSRSGKTRLLSCHVWATSWQGSCVHGIRGPGPLSCLPRGPSPRASQGAVVPVGGPGCGFLVGSLGFLVGSPVLRRLGVRWEHSLPADTSCGAGVGIGPARG